MEHLNPQAIFIVITVFILFVNKVVDMMREKQAERAAKEERQARRAAGSQPPPIEQPPLARKEPAPQQPKPASPFQDVLTELFEAAGVPTNSQPKKPPVTVSKTPPPVPAMVSSATKMLSKAEREALERLELRNERSLVNRQRHQREISDKITRLLLSRDAARQAIMLAEILGPPRGIKEMDRNW